MINSNELNRRLSGFLDENNWKAQAYIVDTIYYDVYEIRVKLDKNGTGVSPENLIQKAFKNAGLISSIQLEENYLYVRFQMEEDLYFYADNKRIKIRELCAEQIEALKRRIAWRLKLQSTVNIVPIFWGKFQGGYKIKTEQTNNEIVGILTTLGGSILPCYKNSDWCYFYVTQKRLSRNFRRRLLKTFFGKVYAKIRR